ncbi:DNA-binding transcriptional LysR family regulator [Pseudochelatococcus contaminans]|uniref:DNA-binding transcriptional LysR family regulator n=2 Tax=Pseudochelatococcus contaminans TaxID=1538103 RepID=A0A7W5Z4B0_9HYPH|nr:DNA-binding transcriptional LysR family regulator [Pseudochelatococcus contaminans]
MGDLDTFAQVVAAGSMSAAGRDMGLSTAVISKRIRRLEERLGVRLLQRTTRQITLTEAGHGLYERAVAILASVEEAEAWVARGSAEVRGVLKVSAPTSFGRMHVAPRLLTFLQRHPGLTVDFNLTDEFVDVVGQGFDVAVRIADLADSSLVARRLAPNHRLLVAAPAYLERAGTPAHIDDLPHHTLLAHNTDHWRLEGPDGQHVVRINAPLRTNSSEVVREAVIAGMGVALRSTWDIGPELRDGSLRAVLPGYGASRRVAVYAVYPSRRHLEQKVRVFVDYLAEIFGPTPYWDEGLALS